MKKKQPASNPIISEHEARTGLTIRFCAVFKRALDQKHRDQRIALHGRVMTVLRKLNSSTSDHQLNQYAEELQISAAFGRIAELPRARNSGGRKAEQEIDTIVRKAEDLGALLLGLHSEALRAFEHVEPRGELHPLMIVDSLAAFVNAAMRARSQIRPTPSPKGNKQRMQARFVTNAACHIYERLTGKRPGRATNAYRDGRPYGALHTFLAALFEALKIQVSADAQLKMFLSSRRRMERMPSELSE